MKLKSFLCPYTRLHTRLLRRCFTTLVVVWPLLMSLLQLGVVEGHRQKGRFDHKHGAADLGEFARDDEDAYKRPIQNPLRRGGQLNMDSVHEKE